MFDIGFWELILIGFIASIALGPERLPHVLHNIGRWIRAARSFTNELQSGLEKNAILSAGTIGTESLEKIQKTHSHNRKLERDLAVSAKEAVYQPPISNLSVRNEHDKMSK